ncbi:MAG: hypothetical protein WC346_11645 [Methanogenium sp.]|jgi:hypothetical protein
MSKQKTITVAEFIKSISPEHRASVMLGLMNSEGFVAFNSTKKTPDLGVTLPNGEHHFVNRQKSNEKWGWVLGPAKVARVAEQIAIDA